MPFLTWIAAILAAAAWAAWVGRTGLVTAQIFQIEEYEAPRLLAWGRQRAWLLPRAALAGAGAALVLSLLAFTLPPDWRALGMAGGLLSAALALHALWERTPVKKPLVYTARMRRLLGAAATLLVLLTLAVAAALIWLPALGLASLAVAALLAPTLSLAAPALALLLVVAGDVVMAPVEGAIRSRFLARARKKFAAIQPRVLGVAGSYGKTSTKHITAQLLQPHIETLATPKSFNTLMGISRTINEYLEPKHKLFIVEMDAYARGEIAAMCRLTPPAIAVITSVGPQHLERFGTVERIAEALYELVAALPPRAPALIYAGDAETARLAERAARAGLRVIRYGIQGDTTAPLDVVASNVQLDAQGARFLWQWPAEHLRQEVSTALLGRHNVLNVSAALALAHLLGYPVAEAVRTARVLEPVPHRLQLMPSTGGITVIDDSYNANPVGVRNGLEVLAQMPGHSKILVTPGMVELGSLEESENRRYGEQAAEVCDHVVLVGGKRTEPIRQGLRGAGFDPQRIHTVQSLDQVTELLGLIAGPGDVVLFANDLPDTYLELKR